MAVGGLDAAILIGHAGIVAGGLHAVVPAQVVVAPGEIKLSVTPRFLKAADSESVRCTRGSPRQSACRQTSATGNQAIVVETGETFEALATHRALEQALC
jgi:hypothetical protein